MPPGLPVVAVPQGEVCPALVEPLAELLVGLAVRGALAPRQRVQFGRQVQTAAEEQGRPIQTG